MTYYHPLSDNDINALESILNKFSNDNKIEALEIGCGRSTTTLLNHCNLTILEIEKERGDIFIDNAQVIICNSLDYVSNKKYDLIFIDGNHLYSVISKELEKFIPMVKIGGIICGHDYEGREYSEAYIEMDCVNARHHGVIKAINEKLIEVDLCPNSCIWSKQL
jgi:hypothetical protein